MDYFVSNAIQNVWCTPAQDEQYIFKMRRLTPYLGFSSRIEVMTTSVSPPIPGVRFHLFGLGVAYPDLSNMVRYPNHWVKFSDCANETLRVVDIYNTIGVRVPLSTTYFTFTVDRVLLVAVQELPVFGVASSAGIPSKMIDFSVDPLFIRVCKNTYFSSERWNLAKIAYGSNIANPIYVEGFVMSTISQVMDLQNKINSTLTQPGRSVFYKNGFIIPSFNLGTLSVGDHIEWVYDASISSVEDYGYLRDIRTFISDMDHRSKYILHNRIRHQSIIYQDDVNLMLVKDGVGVQVPRNATWTLRNLTHSDYSLREDVVGAIILVLGSAWNINNTRLVIHTHHSGYNRPLIDEHRRIKELYKLSDEEILDAMQGVQSTVPEWRAQALEASEYTLIMSGKYSDITKSNVINALGYNAVTRSIAASVHKVPLGATSMAVPTAYSQECTVYYHDNNGYLLGYEEFTNVNAIDVAGDVRYIEFIREALVDSFEEYIDSPGIALQPDRDYRYYVKDISTNPQVNHWVEVPVDDARVRVQNGVMSWLGVSSQFTTLIKSNKGVITQEMDFPMTDGIIAFNLTHKVLSNGLLIDRELQVPPGELDIWINGRYAIRDLDYRVKFPSVVICNKAYLSQQDSQHVVVRMKGLCTDQMGFTDSSEYGFIINGQLSNDNEYDVRDDRCVYINIAGGVATSADVTFEEDAGAVHVSDSTLNGKPYVVKDCIIRLTDVIATDTLKFRDRSVVVDSHVNNYLSGRIDLTDPVAQGSKAGNHVLYSPLISKIVTAIKDGSLPNDSFTGQYSDNEILSLIEPYLYLYEFDPIHPNNRILPGSVDIHPTHLVTYTPLNIWQYGFLNRVVRLLARDLVMLSNHIQIT